MISLLLGLGLVVALVCLARHRSLGAGLALGTTLLLYFGVGTGLLVPVLLDPLQVSYPQIRHPEWGARNAIVLLSAGAVRQPDGEVGPSVWAYSRLAEAARLYRDCRQEGRACTLLVSGGDPDRLGRTEAETYRGLLLGLGVDPKDLLVEARSLNTFQNAQYSSELLRKVNADRILLVSAGVHLRRALRYFAHFGIQAQASASECLGPRRSWIPQAYNLTLADVACHEHLGMLRYRVYQVMGWNPTSPRAGGL